MARLYFNKRLAPLITRYAVLDRARRGVETGMMATLMAAARTLPIERASDLGAALVGYAGPRTRKHRNVVANLRVVFPDRPAEWIERTAVGVWAQIGRVVAEYPHLPRIVREQRVTLEFRFDPEILRHAPRGYLFAAMHQANWNLPAIGGLLGNFPLSVVYQEQRNKGLESLVARWRNTIPCGFIPIEQVVPRTLEELKAGRSVGLFLDHRIDGGDLIPFAGIPAPTTTIPARLTLRAGAGIVPARIERQDGVRFKLTAYPPITAPPELKDFKAGAHAVMEEVNAHFTAWIRERPEDWCAATKHRWSKPALLAADRAGHLPPVAEAA